MKSIARLALAASLAMVSAQATLAKPAASPAKPEATSAAGGAELASPGKVVFEDNFARDEMKPKWRVGKGAWSVKDGVATAAEIPEDKHGAYAYIIAPNFVFKDVVVEYAVKIDGARACHLMINDSKYKESHAGHILKVTLSPGKVNSSDYKFGAMKNDIFEKMKDEKTPADEKKKLRDSIKDKSVDAKLAADVSQWHNVRVEIVGDEMLTLIDGRPAGYIKSEGIGHATKNAIGFEIGGKSVQIKDVKVSEAKPSSEWQKNRETVIGSIK